MSNKESSVRSSVTLLTKVVSIVLLGVLLGASVEGRQIEEPSQEIVEEVDVISTVIGADIDDDLPIYPSEENIIKALGEESKEVEVVSLDTKEDEDIRFTMDAGLYLHARRDKPTSVVSRGGFRPRPEVRFRESGDDVETHSKGKEKVEKVKKEAEAEVYVKSEESKVEKVEKKESKPSKPASKPKAEKTKEVASTTMTVEATAYCPGTPGSGCPTVNGGSYCTGVYANGYTATGVRAKAGNGTRENPHIIAVDPKMMPLGTLVEISGYGYAKAEDVGGAIKGRRIDLLFDTHEEALQFGRRNLELKIIK